MLSVGTRWGKLPIVTDTESYLNLMLVVPASLEPGSSFEAANRNGFLRIGGMDVGYESRSLDGSIRVTESTSEAVVLDLDIWARSPVTDLSGRGEQHIAGRVRAGRVPKADR